MNFKQFITLLLLISIPIFLPCNQYPRPVGLVNDFAAIFDAVSRQNLTNMLTELQEKTTVEIAVVTVQSFGGIDRDSYAVGLYESWGIGSKNDEGLLILLSTEDREIKIEVGYGSEGYLTDGMAGLLLDEYVMPFLVQNDFKQGLLNAGIVFAHHIAQAKNVELAGMPNIIRSETHRTTEFDQKASFQKGSFIFEIILLGIFVFLIIITRGRILIWLLLFARGGRGRHGGGFGGFGGGRSGGGGAGRRF